MRMGQPSVWKPITGTTAASGARSSGDGVVMIIVSGRKPPPQHHSTHLEEQGVPAGLGGLGAGFGSSLPAVARAFSAESADAQQRHFGLAFSALTEVGGAQQQGAPRASRGTKAGTMQTHRNIRNARLATPVPLDGSKGSIPLYDITINNSLCDDSRSQAPAWERTAFQALPDGPGSEAEPRRQRVPGESLGTRGRFRWSHWARRGIQEIREPCGFPRNGVPGVFS